MLCIFRSCLLDPLAQILHSQTQIGFSVGCGGGVHDSVVACREERGEGREAQDQGVDFGVLFRDYVEGGERVCAGGALGLAFVLYAESDWMDVCDQGGELGGCPRRFISFYDLASRLLFSVSLTDVHVVDLE